MEIVKETIIKIELSSPPLKRRRFSNSDIKKQKRQGNYQGSGLLFLKLREHEAMLRERAEEAARHAESEILSQEMLLNAESASSPDIEPIQSEPERAPRFRKFQHSEKKRFSIFDYSELELNELEEDVAELVNQDGYYDEVLPIDHDNKAEKATTKIQVNKTIIAAIVIALLLLVSIISDIRSIF